MTELYFESYGCIFIRLANHLQEQLIISINASGKDALLFIQDKDTTRISVSTASAGVALEILLQLHGKDLIRGSSMKKMLCSTSYFSSPLFLVVKP